VLKGPQGATFGRNAVAGAVIITTRRPDQHIRGERHYRGLLLVVRPNGSKWWRLRYTFQGREKMISLGIYPDVSLSMARERRDAAHRLIAADPRVPKAVRACSFT
jgi:hypothetical protein